MSRIFRVGTRGSGLALAQTHGVIEMLRRAATEATFQVAVVRTEGDRPDAAVSLAVLGVGAFVREIERALCEGRVDIAVHSLKDCPTELAPGTVIAAVPERADPRDVLVSREGLALKDIPPGSRIGTSSARRRAQVLRARPDVEVIAIQGNVGTRLRKLDQGQDGLSAVVLAAAGLVRLELIGRATEFLPCDRFLPSAGQGALAVEVRAEDREAVELAGRLDHAESRIACEAERAFIAALGAGCRAAVGAYATVQGGTVRLEGAVYSQDGSVDIRGQDSGPAGEAAETGARLAGRLGARGAFDIVSAAKEQVG